MTASSGYAVSLPGSGPVRPLAESVRNRSRVSADRVTVAPDPATTLLHPAATPIAASFLRAQGPASSGGLWLWSGRSRAEGGRMAKTQQKDLFSRLADAGEEAVSRLAELPGGHRALEAVHALRDRIDELQKRVLNIEPLERKVTELERRLDALEGKRPATRRTAAAKRPAPRKAPETAPEPETPSG